MIGLQASHWSHDPEYEDGHGVLGGEPADDPVNEIRYDWRNYMGDLGRRREDWF